MKNNICIVFLSLSFFLKAQFLDSIKNIVNSRPGIDLRFETRHSFIKNELVKVSGVRGGVVFRKKLRLGIGYSWLNSDVSEKITIKNSLGNNQVVTNYLKFGYLCYYVDFVFYKEKRWQLSVPIQVGTGLAWFKYNDGVQDVRSKKHFLLLYEPGISVQFKVFKWLGLGTDVAYRFTLKNTKNVGDKLNSPTYAFKLLLWMDQLFYMSFPKSKLTQKFGPAEW